MTSKMNMTRTKTLANKTNKGEETSISDKKIPPKHLSQKEIQKVDPGLITNSVNPKILKSNPKNLLSEIEDKKDQDKLDVSFSLSNSSDIDDFLEKISNKSDEKLEKFEYEGITEEEGKNEINKYLKEKVTEIQKGIKDFNDENNQKGADLYKDIIDKIEGGKQKNNNNNTLDKTKTTNNKTKSESLSASDDRGFKFGMGGDKNNESESKKNNESKEEKVKSASHEKSGINGSRYTSGDNPLKSEVKEIIEDNEKKE